MPPHYTIKEAADLLHLTQNTVREYIKRGRLVAINLGIRKQRIPVEEVERYNRERRQQGGQKGRKQTDEAKRKLSEAHKGDRNPMKGKRHTPEALAKISAVSSQQPRGEASHAWKGGHIRDRVGYVLIYMPEHPYAVHKYVLEHRLVMEQVLGRYLEPREKVHHINGDILDNRPENLKVMTQGEHMRLHRLNPSLRKTNYKKPR